jgi:uncharacterized membrane protein
MMQKINNTSDLLKIGHLIFCMIHEQVRTRLIPRITEYFKDNHENIGTMIYVSYGNYLIYIPLFMEFYYMLFHVLIIRLWLFANFCCSLLCMYNNLNESDSNLRNNVKKFASLCVGSGTVLLIIFGNSMGLFVIPLIIYLINRTLKNVFNKGF